jgi:hypothetical protein
MADIEILDRQREEAIQFLPKMWHTFFGKFKDIEDLKPAQWKQVHLLAHIDKRFRDHYNKNFSYVYNKTPSKCTEMFMVKRMCAMLSTTDMSIAKDYIDWVFDKKIIPQKKKIRTLAFFCVAGLGNEYYMYKRQESEITRDKPLPESYKKVASNCTLPVDVSIETYGHLAFMLMAYKGSRGESKQQYELFFNKLRDLGFKEDIIKGIK